MVYGSSRGRDSASGECWRVVVVVSVVVVASKNKHKKIEKYTKKTGYKKILQWSR